MPVVAHLFEGALAVHALLQTAQRAVHGFAFLELDLGQFNSLPFGLGRRRTLSRALVVKIIKNQGWRNYVHRGLLSTFEMSADLGKSCWLKGLIHVTFSLRKPSEKNQNSLPSRACINL